MAQGGGGTQQRGDEIKESKVVAGDEAEQRGDEMQESKVVVGESKVVGDEAEQRGDEMKERKVVGDETEQMGEVGDRSKQMGDTELGTASLGDDLIERIFLRLPLHSCIRFASLNKRFYSSIRSTVFMNASIAGTQPFFYLWGLDPVTHQTLSCMYDPLADRWFSLNLTNNMKPLSSPFHSYSLTSTPSGTIILYLTCVPSPDNVRLRFASNPTNTDWKISPAASKRFDSFPIVAAFDSGISTPSSSSFEVFVLGELHNGLTIQLYNSAIKSWEVCDVQPTSRRGLYQFMGSFHVSSAVLGRKVYLANIALGTITCFDMDTKSWNTPSRLQALHARSFLISSTKRGLYALGLCVVSEAEECVKLFKVNELTMECKEVSKMPDHLWSLLAEHFEPGTNSVLSFSYARCVGAGSLVYVYNGSYFSKIRICVCDVDAGYRWHQLPPLPDALQWLDLRANCCSFRLQPTFGLKSQYDTEKR